MIEFPLMVEKGKPTVTDPQNTFGLTESDVRSARQKVYQRLIDAIHDRPRNPFAREIAEKELSALMWKDDPGDILQRVREFNDRLKELRELGEKDRIGAILLDEFPSILHYYTLLEKSPLGKELNTLLFVAKVAIDTKI